MTEIKVASSYPSPVPTSPIMVGLRRNCILRGAVERSLLLVSGYATRTQPLARRTLRVWKGGTSAAELACLDWALQLVLA